MSDAKSLRKSGPIGKAMSNGPSGSAASKAGLANTTARPVAAHNEGTNTQQKVTGSTNFGGLGAKGHGGAS